MYSILRTYHPETTTGVLLDPLGNQLAVTLELPWLDNKNNISCIPEGTYSVIAYQSPTKGDVWLIQHVPDRTMIEMHSCNETDQLLGCIGLGLRLAENILFEGKTYRYWITNSRAILKNLKKTMPNSFVVDIRKG